jgi:hypothetical protein
MDDLGGGGKEVVRRDSGSGDPGVPLLCLNRPLEVVARDIAAGAGMEEGTTVS